jgi:hypothetical protein
MIPASNAQPAGVSYELKVVCPQRGDGVPTNELVCPIRAQDFPQYLLGSPSIGLDPNEPEHVILHMLHGSEGDGPTIRSRRGTPFTSFVSSDFGGSWHDRYYPGPGDLRDALGEHPEATVDEFGTFYIGSLYAQKDEAAPGGYRWQIVAQKFKDVFEAAARQNGAYNAQFVDPVTPDGAIRQFWYAYDPIQKIMSMVWDEQPGESFATGDGAGRIAMTWTTPKTSDPYYYVDESQLVSPCVRTSNPVLWKGHVYIVCMLHPTALPFKWGGNRVEGRMDLFRLDPKLGNPINLGTLPVAGGLPKLAVAEDGGLTLLTVNVDPDAGLQFAAAFGELRDEGKVAVWKPPLNLGQAVAPPTLGRKPVDANIQALVLKAQSDVVHFVLKQRFENLGLNINDPGSYSKPIYDKHLFALHADYGILASINLDVGNAVNRTAFNPTPVHAGGDLVFDDLADDLLLLPPGPFSFEGKALGDDYQREFIAVGDYGVAQFAEIIEITELRAAGAPALAYVPPIVAPATAAAGIGVAVAGAALAGLLALKLALNRKSTTTASVARGGKK